MVLWQFSPESETQLSTKSLRDKAEVILFSESAFNFSYLKTAPDFLAPCCCPGLSVYVSVSCICVQIFVSSAMPHALEAEIRVKVEGTARSSQVTLRPQSWNSSAVIYSIEKNCYSSISGLADVRLCRSWVTLGLHSVTMETSTRVLREGICLPLCSSGGGFSISSQDRKEDSSQ